MGKLSSYYNFDKVMSYNAIYNFIMGARGLGKTYGAKEKVISAAINKGDQFILLRRYKTELKGRGSFFADIDHLWPEWDFRVNGFTAEMAPIKTREEKKRLWTPIGHFIALSTAQSFKGVPFPKIKTIIFDEFIIEKGMTHYLPDEATVMMNFLVTVDRFMDKTRVFFLANSVSIMNPYFIEFDIKAEKEIERTPDNFLVAHFPDSKAFQNEVYQTRLGKRIQGTEYAEYAVGSQFADNHEGLIGAKSSTAKYYFTLETKDGIFSLWSDFTTARPTYYAQAKRPKQEILWTMELESMTESKQMVYYSDKSMQVLRAAFKQGRIWFDSPRTRNSFRQVFKR